MNQPYILYKELLPCGRSAWRRMVNPTLQRNLKPIDLTSQVVHHKPMVVFGHSLVFPDLVVNLPREK